MKKTRTTKKVTISEPVKLRFRESETGSQSIYLDYIVNGKRRFEFLKLYILPGTSRDVKAANKEAMRMALIIKSQRTLELQMPEAMEETTNSNTPAATSNDGVTQNVASYIDKLCESDVISDATKNYYRNVRKHLGAFYGKRLTFGRIDRHLLLDFVTRLLTAKATRGKDSKKPKANVRRYCNNSVIKMYSILRSIINKAYRDGIITTNPTEEFEISDYVKMEHTDRVFLELDELRRFAAAETAYRLEQQAFVFACLCGLRISDIRQLRWCDIRSAKGHYSINIEMTKTRTRIALPLSDEAITWLPTRGNAEATATVFPLITHTFVNKRIRSIARAAGITKHLTFHNSRHTHATMLLTLVADLYTVSKLLGHHSIATTQLYARIVDRKKVAAIALIPNLMEEE